MRKKTKNRHGAIGLQVLMLLFLLLVGANGAYAQGDLHLLHASKIFKKVVLDSRPIHKYMATQKLQQGIWVIRPIYIHKITLKQLLYENDYRK